MELMLDSAKIDEIKEIKSTGLLEGLTTNPVIIKRAIEATNYKGNFLDFAKSILKEMDNKPTFFQIISYSEKDIIDDANKLYDNLKNYGNIYIKVPINTSIVEKKDNYSGFNAIKKLKQIGIPVLATAVTTPVQAFLAAKAGADYTALILRNYDSMIVEKLELKELGEEEHLNNEEVLTKYIKIGKRQDCFLSGIDNLSRTEKIIKSQTLESKIIIAGIRNVVQVSEILERKDIHAMTLPYKVWVSMFSNKATMKFVEQTYSTAPNCYRNFFNHE